MLPDAGDMSLIATSDTWQKALPLYLDVQLNPGFRQEDFDQLKDNSLKNIAASQDDLWTVTVNNFRKGFFGPGGYGNADIGTAETVGNLTLDDVKNYYPQNYVPNNMVVSVAGNFNPQVMLARLRSRLGNLPAGQPYSARHPRCRSPRTDRHHDARFGRQLPDWRIRRLGLERRLCCHEGAEHDCRRGHEQPALCGAA